MKLSRQGQEKAGAFVRERARPLERRLLSFHFHDGTAADVLAELAKYQNADGGFGQALEPDLRLADSSVLATTVGLQILRELGAGPNESLVQSAVRYLLETYEAEHAAWPIVPPNADDAPHAPWWVPPEDRRAFMMAAA